MGEDTIDAQLKRRRLEQDLEDRVTAKHRREQQQVQGAQALAARDPRFLPLYTELKMLAEQIPEKSPGAESRVPPTRTPRTPRDQAQHDYRAYRRIAQQEAPAKTLEVRVPDFAEVLMCEDGAYVEARVFVPRAALARDQESQ